ncbi:hypothetical protein BU17DRAFT_70142 [Hysterangium stoloniferum]|nr:hypothetical protein BU17DRAFT_70142 [Hysterangium stoloniferum]
MNVTFLKNCYVDSLIVNTADGTPLYQANSPGLIHRTTSIHRIIPDAGPGDLVAEIQWSATALGSSKVTYRGVTIEMKSLLERPHFLSTSRVFTGRDGRQYKWKYTANKFELFDVLTNALLAESHRYKYGLTGPSRKLNVDISPQATHMLDDVIITFIIVAEERNLNEDGYTTGTVVMPSN